MDPSRSLTTQRATTHRRPSPRPPRQGRGPHRTSGSGLPSLPKKASNTGASHNRYAGPPPLFLDRIRTFRDRCRGSAVSNRSEELQRGTPLSLWHSKSAQDPCARCTGHMHDHHTQHTRTILGKTASMPPTNA
jgi:hypothetical protein